MIPEDKLEQFKADFISGKMNGMKFTYAGNPVIVYGLDSASNRRDDTERAQIGFKRTDTIYADNMVVSFREAKQVFCIKEGFTVSFLKKLLQKSES